MILTIVPLIFHESKRTTKGEGEEEGAFVIFTQKENVQQLRSEYGSPGASEARSCSDLGAGPCAAVRSVYR